MHLIIWFILLKEELYKNLRPYGRLVDLTYPSPSTKDLPRFAIAQFRNIASAASAKNCLHGVELNGTRLNLSYEKIIVRFIPLIFYDKIG